MKKQDAIQKLNPGGYYHIYNRGNNKEDIFKEPGNYIYFLQLWAKYISPVAHSFCYCLLPNHFHFFIRIKELEEETGKASAGKLSSTKPPVSIEQSFSNLFNAYAKAINKRTGRTGSLFQERFRRKEVLDHTYFTTLMCYIMTNAEKHGISQQAGTYAYSSYHSLLSDKPTLLLRQEVLDWFGGKKWLEQAVMGYAQNIIDDRHFLESWEDEVMD